MVEHKPSWRGWMHAAAFAAAIPAGLILLLAADRTVERVAVGAYALALLLSFGASAAYHRLSRGERSRQILQRLDHSMIYVLIAGTYVPICLLVLTPAWGIPLLAVLAGAATLGIILKLAAFRTTRHYSTALYLVMGWAAVIALPVLIDRMTSLQLGLIVAGGLAYTIGFPVLMTHRPNPWPRTFGYHEVWHSFTVVAAVLHFAAVSDVVA
ncbi:MAG: PAQR family membrane homeostasis protein TrhA [Ilumatobacteraceae bacterium]